MQVELSVFFVVMLIVIIHTVFTHLFNWAFRSVEEDAMPLCLAGQVAELIVLVVLLYSVLH